MSATLKWHAAEPSAPHDGNAGSNLAAQCPSRLSHVAWRSVELRDGSRITVRVMRSEDAAIEQEFVRQLSDRARILRFFSGLKQLSPYLLQSLTSPEFPETYALLASISDGGQERQIGVARYAPTDVDGPPCTPSLRSK